MESMLTNSFAFVMIDLIRKRVMMVILWDSKSLGGFISIIFLVFDCSRLGVDLSCSDLIDRFKINLLF